jgi:hypothetical protein
LGSRDFRGSLWRYGGNHHTDLENDKMSKRIIGSGTQTEIANDGHWDREDEVEVSVPLSAEENADVKDRLSKLIEEWDALIDERRLVNQRYNVRIKEKRTEATTLAAQANAGSQKIMVKATIRYYPDSKTKVATDHNGKELWKHSMTPADFEMAPNTDQGESEEAGE